MNERNYKEENRRRRDSLRRRVLEKYGQICSCCSEKEEKFLTLDHVKNDGYPRSRTERQRISMMEMYGRVVKENYPGNYTILCYNCNNGKRINKGMCPHQNEPIKSIKVWQNQK